MLNPRRGTVIIAGPPFEAEQWGGVPCESIFDSIHTTIEFSGYDPSQIGEVIDDALFSGVLPQKYDFDYFYGPEGKVYRKERGCRLVHDGR